MANRLAAFSFWRSDFARALDDSRHETVGFRLFGIEPVVALGILEDLLEGLPRLRRDLAVEALAHLEDFFVLDGDVRRLAAHAAQGLVQQEAREREAEAVLFPGAE